MWYEQSRQVVGMARQLHDSGLVGTVPPTDSQISKPVAILWVKPEAAVISLNNMRASVNLCHERFWCKCNWHFLACDDARQPIQDEARTSRRMVFSMGGIGKP